MKLFFIKIILTWLCNTIHVNKNIFLIKSAIFQANKLKFEIRFTIRYENYKAYKRIIYKLAKKKIKIAQTLIRRGSKLIKEYSRRKNILRKVKICMQTQW